MRRKPVSSKAMIERAIIELSSYLMFRSRDKKIVALRTARGLIQRVLRHFADED